MRKGPGALVALVLQSSASPALWRKGRAVLLLRTFDITSRVVG